MANELTGEITSTSFARAGLLGNPSDGYGGKAIAFSVRNFQASVTLRPSAKLEIRMHPDEAVATADSIDDLVARLNNFGYYGGTRLIKAAIQRFHQFCENRHSLHGRNFSIEYQTNIPRSVGLAGSSAIITAALKSLTRFYELDIPTAVLATLALETETKLLGIPAGLMDRVIQMLEGIAFLDLSMGAMHQNSDVLVGQYSKIQQSACEEHLYVAWAAGAAEPTEVLHNRLRERFERGDADVLSAMQRFAELAEQGRVALNNDDVTELGTAIDENLDLRASICQLPKLHEQMVQLARQAGGTAKFCGSGGAIVGTASDEETFLAISKSLATIDCQVIRPQIRA